MMTEGRMGTTEEWQGTREILRAPALKFRGPAVGSGRVHRESHVQPPPPSLGLSRIGVQVCARARARSCGVQVYTGGGCVCAFARARSRAPDQP